MFKVLGANTGVFRRFMRVLRRVGSRRRHSDDPFHLIASVSQGQLPINDPKRGITQLHQSRTAYDIVEPEPARGVCVRLVGVFKSPEPTTASSSSQENCANGQPNGLRALETTDRGMHRQFTASSNGDEEFTNEELQEFAQAFKLFDKDGNGTMNIKELGVAMRTLGLNPTEEELLNIVNEYDADQNGKIDFGEFCKMMKATNKETDESLIRLAFKVFDKDGNGYITAQEFKHFMTTMGEKFSVEEVDEIIKEIDKDGDEQIDYEEFVNSFAAIVHDNDKTDLFAEPPPVFHHHGKK
ncbi:Calmodulin-like protein 3 [Aphelenchoides besseyi]|nr:Calmodulin-like protein 3 [Aphelenchoides besseyi]